MAQNLNVGTKINSSDDQTNNSIIEKYCYGNLESACDVYGGWYQWDEYMNYTSSSSSNPSGRQGICPTGWHIPSDAEWSELTSFLGGTSIAGGELKEAGTLHWMSPNTGANNSSGFTALPGGYRHPDGAMDLPGGSAKFWSATEYSSIYPWFRHMDYSSGVVYIYNDYYKTSGLTVRCLKD